LNGDIYRIVNQPYDRTTELWKFEPGDKVVCEQIKSSDGWILVATKKAEDYPSTPPRPSDRLQ
jgi:hypothetical protein